MSSTHGSQDYFIKLVHAVGLWYKHTMHINSIIFDFDNTIAQSEVLITDILRILRKYRKINDEAEAIDIIRKIPSDFHRFKYFLEGSSINMAYKELLMINLRHVEDAYYGSNVIASIKKLASRFNLFIASGRDVFSLRYSLQKKDLYKYFKEVVGMNELFSPKPSPTMLKYLFEKHRLDPQNCTYIGDKYNDFLTAKAAGCKFIGALWYRKEPLLLKSDKNINCTDPINLEIQVQKLLRG